MRFQIIKIGYLECDKGFITIGRDMGKIARFPVYCFLIQHKKGNVLIDTGFSKDFRQTWGKRLWYFIPILEKDIIGSINLPINYIINTHLHIDHCENNHNFEDAKIIVQKRELEIASSPKPHQKLSYPDNLNLNLNYLLIENDLDLFNDKSIVIVKTPGHTEGHQSVFLNMPKRRMFIAGDACYTYENLKYNVLPGIVWNSDKVIECYDMIRKLRNTEIIFGHDTRGLIL